MTKFIRETVLITSAGTFSSLNGDGLYLTFDVAKTTTGIPNEATFTIYNLSDASRDAIGVEGEPITLMAGYRDEGNMGIIFSGFVRDVKTERQDVDLLTKVDAGDGDKGLKEGYISKTFDKGTTVDEMVKFAQTQMPGVDLGEMQFPDDMPVPEKHVSFLTTPRRMLDELGRSYGFYWSIQDGALEVIPVDGFLDYETFISPETGMIGVPSITDSGVTVKTLLDPDIRPNHKVYVKSETTDRLGKSGLYRVSSVAHGGTNRDGEFYTELEAETINGGKVATA